jgi:hypothetical protein
MDWDWDLSPTYESERVRIDASSTPAILYDMKLPRRIEDHEVGLMLGIADHHLDRGLPFVALVRQQRGSGVISARHRKAFGDWLEERRDALQRSNFAIVIAMPEAIFRAVLRVVYRFRTPPLRTITTSDVSSGAAAVRSELRRMGEPITPEIETFLDSIPS